MVKCVQNKGLGRVIALFVSSSVNPKCDSQLSTGRRPQVATQWTKHTTAQNLVDAFKTMSLK